MLFFTSATRVACMRNISFLFREKRSWKMVGENFIEFAVVEKMEQKDTRSSPRKWVKVKLTAPSIKVESFI